MAIKYFKLLDMLNKRGMSKGDLRKAAVFSSATMAKISSHKPVNLAVIDSICEALNCQPGDLMEYIPGGNTPSASPAKPKSAKPKSAKPAAPVPVKSAYTHASAGNVSALEYPSDDILLSIPNEDVTKYTRFWDIGFGTELERRRKVWVRLTPERQAELLRGRT